MSDLRDRIEREIFAETKDHVTTEEIMGLVDRCVSEKLAAQSARFADTLEAHIQERLEEQREAIAVLLEGKASSVGLDEDGADVGVRFAARVVRGYGKEKSSG